MFKLLMDWATNNHCSCIASPKIMIWVCTISQWGINILGVSERTFLGWHVSGAICAPTLNMQHLTCFGWAMVRGFLTYAIGRIAFGQQKMREFSWRTSRKILMNLFINGNLDHRDSLLRTTPISPLNNNCHIESSNYEKVVVNHNSQKLR